MTVKNRFRGWSPDNGETSRNNSPDFGENLNRDIDALNTENVSVYNSYSSGHTNRFGASTQYSTNELQFLQSMVTESIHINGITVRYMPRMSDYTDELFNEAPESVFDHGLQMPVYLESTSGFEGEGDQMTQFGIEFQEEVILRMSIPKFEELYGAYQETADPKYKRKRPYEGDLIVIPFGISSLNNNQYMPKFFEILRVTTFKDGAFFQAGDNYQYKIRARLFELAGEDIQYDPEIKEVEVIGDSEKPVVTHINNEDSIEPEGFVNITNKDSDIADPFANNHVTEVMSQERTLYSSTGEELKEKQPVMTKDYTAKAFGYGSVINNLDDI